MTDPETDDDLKKAIDDRTIPVPPPPVPPELTERGDSEQTNTLSDDSGLGQNVGDFEIDVPPPEGI